jgi:hypothetical protein
MYNVQCGNTKGFAVAKPFFMYTKPARSATVSATRQTLQVCPNVKQALPDAITR